MAALFYVATYNGFLVIEPVPGGRDRVYTASDVRSATPFSSFRHAEAAGKWGTGKLFPRDKSYFAVVQVACGEQPGSMPVGRMEQTRTQTAKTTKGQE